MKKILFAAVFCLISNVACSTKETFDAIEIKLNEETKDKLLKLSIESINKDKPGHWQKDAKITLAGFYLLKDEYQNTDNPRYVVRLEGRYKRNVLVNGIPMLPTICQSTNGVYRKNELHALGFRIRSKYSI